MSAPSFDRDKLIKTLEGIPECTLAILYGSFAKGTAHEKSDIDLAIASSHPISAERRIDLILDTSQALGKEVDLIDLNQTHGLILQQALTQGKILVCKDTNLYFKILQRFLYSQADFMPLQDRLLRQRRERFLRGSKNH